MKENRISGIPVVEGGGNGKAGKLVGILTNRDVRFATDPQPDGRRADDQGQARHRARGRRARTRPSACCISTASRSCWWSTSQYRCVGLITVKDIEKARDQSERLQGRAGPPARRRRHHRRRQRLRAHRGADRGRRRSASWSTPRTAIRSGVLDAVTRIKTHVERGAGDRRQRRHRRGRQGADRLRRRRHQGRHRPGLDLHHAHRRRRRRAAAHRDHGRGRGGARKPASR